MTFDGARGSCDQVWLKSIMGMAEKERRKKEGTSKKQYPAIDKTITKTKNNKQQQQQQQQNIWSSHSMSILLYMWTLYIHFAITNYAISKSIVMFIVPYNFCEMSILLDLHVYMVTLWFFFLFFFFFVYKSTSSSPADSPVDSSNTLSNTSHDTCLIDLKESKITYKVTPIFLQ